MPRRAGDYGYRPANQDGDRLDYRAFCGGQADMIVDGALDLLMQQKGPARRLDAVGPACPVET
jgi:hypothetical protein